MIAAFKDGQDLHKIAGAALYGISLENVSKEQRREAKIFNFSTLYGAGIDKVADQFKVTKAKAKVLIDNYYKTFKDLKAYQERTLLEALNVGYIVTDSLGRRSYLPNFDKYLITKNKKQLAEYTRLNSNYRIQGTAASMMKLAAIYLRAKLKGTSGQIVLLIHDEVVVECDKKDAETIKVYVEEAMNQAAKLFCPSVPPPADAIISQCWNK